MQIGDHNTTIKITGLKRKSGDPLYIRELLLYVLTEGLRQKHAFS